MSIDRSNTPRPEPQSDPMTRRGFIQATALGSLSLGAAAFAVPGAFFAVPGAFAQALEETASMSEGPFYPDEMPLDTDNDLLIVNDSITPALGEITHLSGRVLTAAGEPVRSAFVEIWQVDAHASYLHTGGRQAQYDANFQGYGRFLTDSRGQYYFRTIKPVPYTLGGTFRAPHIHFALSKGGNRIMTTQAHVRGHADNVRDPLLGRIRNAAAVETVLVDFTPLPGSPIGELAAVFDIVIGQTLEEIEGDPTGGLGAPNRMGGRGGFGGRARRGGRG